MPLLRFIPETTNVNFVRWRWLAFSIDGLLTVISLVSILHLGFNMGLDFTGGVELEVKAARVIDVAQMRHRGRSVAGRNVAGARTALAHQLHKCLGMEPRRIGTLPHAAFDARRLRRL